MTFLHLETRDANLSLVQFSKLLLVLLSPSTFLGSVSMFKTFMHGYLCVATFLHLETRGANFHWFSFPNIPLFQFSPSPILGSILTFQTFMHGHLCVMTFLHLETGDSNFLLIQFSKLSFGSVFPITHPRFCFNVSNIYAWTFMHGGLFALRNRRFKFSIDSVFQTFLWFIFPHHPY